MQTNSLLTPRSTSEADNRTKSLQILLVEDDERLRNELAIFLKQNGHAVVEASTGNEGVQIALARDFDAIILDLMLPEIGGLQFLEVFRKSKSTPIIMISSMTEVDYRLAALQSGVDDFLVKPLSHKEILERIKAILRRSKTDSRELLKVRDISIDKTTKSVRKNDEIIHLTPTEFDLLAILVQNQGRILARSFLQDAIFGKDRQEYGNIVDQYIMRLRRKLGKDLITTKSGFGFVIHV